MRGRLEHKMKIESSIQNKINDMPDYIRRFYYSLNQKSHTTKNVYIANVIRFLNWKYKGKLPELEEINLIESYDIQVYMSNIVYFEKNGETQELKSTSQATIYSSLSSFFAFLNKYYKTENNPFNSKLIERPTIRENDIVYLTPEEVRKVENEILNGVGDSLSVARQKDWKYRDLLLFRIPVVNGLRVTALSEINIEDINLEERTILVTEKRNITKKVDYDKKTGEYLELWLKKRKEILGDKAETEKSLFISNRKNRITVRSIENIVSKYTTCIEGKHITPHKLRSTCGTNTYQATGDIYLVSKILGHKNTAPTRRYAAVLDTDKRDAINKIASMY